jgi:amino acid transporter
VRFGKWTQNGLTCAKLAGLLAVIGVGLLLTRPEPMAAGALSEPAPAGWSLALIMVLFAYGGWNEMSYVAAEIREPEKNVLRALLLGSLTVSAVYLLVNVAFLRTLGFEGLRTSQAVAADVVELRFAAWGESAISLLICVSCLGTINGMLFTGARIYYAMGTEHPLFRWLGNWSGRVEAPTHALVLQAVVTLALVVGFGPDQRAFERLVIFTTPVFWCFFLLVGISLFVLRARDPATPRVFRVIAYPWTPLAFCLACLFMLQASLAWAVHNRSREVLWSVGILLAGVVVYLGDLLLRHRSRLRD